MIHATRRARETDASDSGIPDVELDVVVATLLYDAADLKSMHGSDSRLGAAFESVALALERRGREYVADGKDAP